MAGIFIGKTALYVEKNSPRIIQIRHRDVAITTDRTITPGTITIIILLFTYYLVQVLLLPDCLCCKSAICKTLTYLTPACNNTFLLNNLFDCSRTSLRLVQHTVSTAVAFARRKMSLIKHYQQ